MTTNLWKWMPAAFGLAVAAALAPVSEAQCGAKLPSIKPMSGQVESAGAHLLRTGAKNDAAPTASIVGMWHVVFTATTSNGAVIPKTVIDSALQVWHNDGTEMMNSGRPPQDGNFCMGVYEPTGELTYKLNHFAWGANDYVPGTAEGVVGPPIGGVHYQETIVLGPGGKHYTGSFTLDEYDTAGRVVQSFTGTLKATRITVNTTFGELL